MPWPHSLPRPRQHTRDWNPGPTSGQVLFQGQMACVASLALLANLVLRQVPNVIPASTVGRQAPKPGHSAPPLAAEGKAAVPLTAAAWGWRWGQGSPAAASGHSPHSGASLLCMAMRLTLSGACYFK